MRRGLSLQTSTDGGLTWSQPVSVAPLSLAGAFPAIQPNGTLVIVYRTGTRNQQELAAVRSRDGGSSLEQPVLVSPIQAFVVGLRLPVLPAVDVDPSGRIWVTWHDCVRRRACLGNDVVVSTSTDGVAWSGAEARHERPDRGDSDDRGRPVRAGGWRFSTTSCVRAGIDAELVESRDAGATWGDAADASMRRRCSVPGSPTPTRERMLADYISVSYAAGGRSPSGRSHRNRSRRAQAGDLRDSVIITARL